MTEEINKRLRKSGIKRILQIYLSLILQAVILFIAAGHLNIPRVWFYVCLSFGYFTISGLIIIKINPEIINQRGQKHKGTKTWDKVIMTLFLSMTFIVFLIAGLDVGRFGWSSMSAQYSIIGSVIYIAAAMFAQWAMVVNPHFEPTVRIQKDRNHKVITTGPYKIVRHPGYVGAILLTISIPLIIGSIFALIPTGIIFLLFIIRTELEDKMLHSELNGYAEYAERVKYRLIPGVW